jgi:hypothetical protein
VIVSVLGFFEAFLPFNVTVLRLLRGTRILRLFKQLNDLADLIYSLYDTLKSFAIVILMLFLIMFVFTLIGLQLFGEIEHGKYGAINEHTNFRTSYSTQQILWRTLTS